MVYVGSLTNATLLFNFFFIWASHRVLPLQFELIDSQGLCVFQHLDVLHLLLVASQLLIDQDLHTPGDGVNFHTFSYLKSKFVALISRDNRRWSVQWAVG